MIPEYQIQIDESDRQMILLALGHLMVERPGWEYAIGEIGKKLGDIDGAMLLTFKNTAILSNIKHALADARECLKKLTVENLGVAPVLEEVRQAEALLAPDIPYEKNLEALIGLKPK